MIISSLRTIYGLNLQTTHINNLPYKILPNTTLNEKFNILVNEELPENTYPFINYYSIGIGGVNLVNGINGYNVSRHSPLDAGLFEEIPFIIRPVNNDLLPSLQTKYRFKKKEIINGIEYYCYYLKKIDHSVTREGLYNVTVNNGVSTLSIFNTNTNDLLNPVPRDRTNDMLDINLTKYITNVIKLKFTLYKDELEEINNALDIKYPNEDKRLTEIAVCSGLDKTTTLDDADITEASCVQIMYHYQIEVYPEMLINEDKELVRSLEIGGMEPMLI